MGYSSMYILGIETSCDETACAIVSRDYQAIPCILANIVHSQIKDHAIFGGVVPEIAARAHLDKLDGTLAKALEKADKKLQQMDAIAVTAGPGLIGGLLVGIMTAKALARVTGKPLLGINHLEGHALTPRLIEQLNFPYLLLLVSGGHTQILLVRNVGHYERWASTIDDALGEAFDKSAKILGLPYPGGPSLECAGSNGNSARFSFPRPLNGQGSMNFSFSGLKTAVRIEAEKLTPLSDQNIADLSASFQQAICDVLVDRVSMAMKKFSAIYPELPVPSLVIAGGVAANGHIRYCLHHLAEQMGWRLHAPPAPLCTDNAAMIAWAGMERLEAGLKIDDKIVPRSRWPLDERAKGMIGAGRRGVKV